jgi:hypothetical protein
MVIAVFGMRIVFPLAIVAIAGIGPVEAPLSANEPARYEAIAGSACRHCRLRWRVSGDGGPVVLLRRRKEVHWIRWIEEKLSLSPTSRPPRIGR